MSQPRALDEEFEQRASSRLLDVLIRAGLIGVLAVLCYVVFAPFLALMAWAVILAVTLYPLHRSLARMIGGKQGLAATIVVLGGVLLIVTPSVLLMNSFGSSIYDFVRAVQHNTLDIPAPRGGRQRMADRGQQDLPHLVTGPLGLAWARREPAAQDRRTGQKGAFSGREHRSRYAELSGVIHRCRCADGVR
jgi:predicted PurR-regulated permease PerM